MTLQKARRRRVHYEQSTENLEHVEPDSLHVPQMSAAEAVLLAERNMYIRQSIHTLPPRLREPVLLYFYGEMSQQDIARRLNLSHANVRKRLQHARALLRSRLTLYLQGDTGAAGSTAWTLPAYPAGLSRRKTCDRE
jgi:RNA polymerase sigma-70 factor (ECF subfamily)